MTLTANATDNVGVTGVQFQLDGTNVTGPMTVVGPAYTYSWNSKTATNGPHTLTAIATTRRAIRPPAAFGDGINDTTPPKVTLTSPASGATVSGMVK